MKVPRQIPLTGALAIAMMLAGCGGGGGGGGGDAADDSLPDSAAASSDDEEGTTYPLRGGRYRLSYRAADCEDVAIAVTGADGAVAYEGTPRTFTIPISDLASGEYTIAVTSDCDDWTIDMKAF